jgi:hypothetical protein
MPGLMPKHRFLSPGKTATNGSPARTQFSGGESIEVRRPAPKIVSTIAQDRRPGHTEKALPVLGRESVRI